MYIYVEIRTYIDVETAGHKIQSFSTSRYLFL